MDPLKLREINGAREGTKATHGPTWVNIGYQKTLEAARASEHLNTPLKPGQGRGIASGYWHNAGGAPRAARPLNADGPATVTQGHPRTRGASAPTSAPSAAALRAPPPWGLSPTSR